MLRAVQYINAQARAHARALTDTHTHACARAHTHARARAHAYTRTRARAHRHTRARARSHTHAHIRTHVRARTHIHTHTHTHTHTHVRRRPGAPRSALTCAHSAKDRSVARCVRVRACVPHCAYQRARPSCARLPLGHRLMVGCASMRVRACACVRRCVHTTVSVLAPQLTLQNPNERANVLCHASPLASKSSLPCHAFPRASQSNVPCRAVPCLPSSLFRVYTGPRPSLVQGGGPAWTPSSPAQFTCHLRAT